MKSEHTKIILAVVLLGVAVGLFFYFNHEPSSIPDSVKFVCISTGEVFTYSRSSMPTRVPAENPKTGEPTLIPAREEDGKLYASTNYGYRCLNDPQYAALNKYIDPDTLEVLDTPLQR